MHIPQSPDTTDFIDGVKLAKVKRGCMLLNFSREGLVHESAVLAALTSGRLSAYITDFPSPELIRRQQQKGDVLLTPHLGASTEEAERNCGIMDVLSEHSRNVAAMSNESRGEVALNLIDLDSQPSPEAIVALEQQPAVGKGAFVGEFLAKSATLALDVYALGI